MRDVGCNVIAGSEIGVGDIATPAPLTTKPTPTRVSPAGSPVPPAVILAGGVVYEAEDATIDQGVVETEWLGRKTNSPGTGGN